MPNDYGTHIERLRETRERAIDEMKIGGDPQKAIAWAILHMATAVMDLSKAQS